MASNISSTASQRGIAPTARCPHGIGLAFFDLDGTILAEGRKVRPRVIETLRRAHDLGVITAVSSGRPISMVPASLREMGIMDYFVCTNGASVYDASLTKVMDAGMPSQLARGLVWALRPLGATWNCFIDGHGFAEVRNSTYMMVSHAPTNGSRRSLLPRLMRWGARMVFGTGSFRQVVRIGPTLAHHKRIEKLGCSFKTAEDTYDAVRLLVDSGLVEVAIMSSRELEITAKGVSKGTGASWLIGRLGIDARRTVAFGDGGNDASLADVVGTLVAMGNSDMRLKEVATCECGDIDGDGVALWLDEQMSEAESAPRDVVS